MMNTTRTDVTATFARLQDGSWGLRVPARVTAGQSVVAVTKDGRRETKTIGAVLCQAIGDMPALCTIAQSSPVRSQRSSGARRFTGGAAANVRGYSSWCTGRSTCGCYDCAS